jgi:NADH-quinone oxidoreductase subunit L
MTAPLMVLAVLSIVGGFFPVPHFLEPVFPARELGHHDPSLAIIATAAGLAGIGLAYLFYVLRPGLPDKVASALGGFYRLVYNKYFVDEVYDAAIVTPVSAGSRVLLWRVADVGLIDGAVNGLGKLAQGIGSGLRTLQSGNIRSYAAWVVAGSVLVLFFIGLMGGVR